MSLFLVMCSAVNELNSSVPSPMGKCSVVSVKEDLALDSGCSGNCLLESHLCTVTAKP